MKKKSSKPGNIENCLLILEMFDSIIFGWLGIWYVKSFIIDINFKIISLNDCINSALAILLMFVIVKKQKHIGIKTILVSCAVSYIGLIGLLVNNETFLLLSTLFGAVFLTHDRAFHNSILAQNIEKKNRANYDNWNFLVDKTGKIIGAAFAFCTLFETLPMFMIWITIFILLDINFFIKIVMIHTGLLVYENITNETNENGDYKNAR